jgi:superfamily II DNA or RNA helicase
MSKYREKFADYCVEQVHSMPTADKNLEMDLHQQEAMEPLAVALKCKSRAFSIVHSCGSGKTILEGNIVTASQRAKKDLKAGDRFDLILTTERALIHSIREQLLSLGLDLGVWGGGKKILDRPVILGSIQALQYNRENLDHFLPPEKIDLVVGDEADMYLTESRKRVIRTFNNSLKVGLTATPKWQDGRGIEEIWGEKIHEMKLKEGILKGVNVPPLFYLFEANLDDRKLILSQGDYDRKTMQSAMIQAELQKAIPEVYGSLVPAKRRKDFPTLIFVPSVHLVQATVRELKKKFSGQDLNVKSWIGESTSENEIKKDINDFNNGNVDILVLCEMGGRGIDLPRARCLIDGYPTLSATKLEQRHGRILRKIREESVMGKLGHKKPFALVAQIIPKSNRYRPYLLPDLLDCWPDFVAGRILGSNGLGGGFFGGDIGAAVQQEVALIRENLVGGGCSVHVHKIDEVNIYAELELREKLPQANVDGFFLIGDERYSTVDSWSKTLGLNGKIIGGQLKGEKGITGKDSRNVIRVNGFFGENTVLGKCADYLIDMPKADNNGFFILGGKRYGTVYAWTSEIDVCCRTLKKCLEGEKGITGKDAAGRIRKYSYYEESIVKERCIKHIKKNPITDANGFFVLHNKKYGTAYAWSKVLGLSEEMIKKKLKNVKGITGRVAGGRIMQDSFFDEEKVREVCSMLFVEMPRADESGFFTLEGERFGTVKAWTREFRVTSSTITRRLRGIQGITGKLSGGQIITDGFYGERCARAKCADLFEELLMADQDGFIYVNGKRYGAIEPWRKELGISHATIRNRLDGEIGMTARDSKGRIIREGFYEEAVVKKKCADLLASG